MTDSEKLDLLLTGMTNLAGKVDNLENRFDNLENRFDNLESRFDNLESRFDNLEQQVGSLQVTVEGMQGDIAALKDGQTKIRMDLKVLDQRMDDTYQLALEAWGTSIENRVLITN